MKRDKIQIYGMDLEDIRSTDVLPLYDELKKQFNYSYIILRSL